MAISNARSSAGICRIILILIGAGSVGLGLYSHFHSAWTTSFLDSLRIKAYQICDVNWTKEPCPPIAYERFYVAVVTISLIVSVFGLILYLILDDMGGNCFLRACDIGYHIVAAVALAIAGILYIVSAEQISGLMHWFWSENLGGKLMRTEKQIAGAIAIFQALLYGITAFVVSKS